MQYDLVMETMVEIDKMDFVNQPSWDISANISNSNKD